MPITTGTILPTLYKKSKTGAVVYCVISTSGANITVETGQVGTDKPTLHHTTCEPKNVGKSNETTSSAQAAIEAEAKWTKKRKTGYVINESGESSIQLPMKVKVYQDQLKNVDFPCYTSPKLNGVNYTVRFDGTNLTGWSRGGEPYTIPPQQVDELTELMAAYGFTELNGEQYIHDMHLQDIQAAVTKPNSDTKNLILYIFDLPDMENCPYSERAIFIDRLAAKNTFKMHIEFVPIRFYVPDHETIRRHFLQDIEAGYEGTVIRNASGLYKHNQRSSDVFKYKEALDAEFRVLDFTLDKYSHPVYTCVCNITLDDYKYQVSQLSGAARTAFIKLHTFKVKRKGTANERLADAIDAPNKLGAWLTVEYESLSKANKPTKPVGLNFRFCDTSGNPIE